MFKYEKPELEELELILEGSFLKDLSVDKGDNPYDGDDWD